MPITAKTTVINTALAHLGEPTFDDIEQAPAPSNLAKALAHVDLARDWALSRHPWLCALVHASIDPAARAGNWKYPYVFELPATAIRLWEVANACKFMKGSEDVAGAMKVVIWADTAGPLDVAYVDRLAWEAYSADLINVMAYELAGRLAGPIQGDLALGREMHGKAVEMLALAEGSEGGEEGGQDPIFPSGFAALRRSAG